jgi:Cu2+-exporting ATPase
VSAATLLDTGIFLDGLRCAGCAQRIERLLRETPGVVEAHVNFTTLRAQIRHAPVLAAADLVQRVESIGYGAIPYDPAALDRPADRNAREALSRLLVAAFLAGNVMVIAEALYLGQNGMEPALRRTLRWLCVALSLPAATWCALPFWRGAWQGLRRREITMDLPIVLGLCAALLGNTLATWAESPRVFADSAAMIVFLILLGRTLERGARARAAGAVERLLARAPRVARRISERGIEQIAVAALARGDRVIVAPGETIPVDARVIAGASEIDTSLITGESQPIACAVGDRVAGGVNNLLAELTLEVTAPAREGTLAQMAALLERAAAERPRVQRTADRIASRFAPALLAIAVVTGLGWMLAGAAPLEALLTVSAVLIVACPCALGLAAPAAITAAIGRAAQLGVLVKSGEALERCARVDCAILDKTGTLTEAALVVDRVAVSGVSDTRVLALAAAAEGSSLHPLAAGIHRAAQARAIATPAAELRRAYPGLGVEAKVDGEPVRVGTRAFLEQSGVAVPPQLAEEAHAMAASGLTLAWVACGGNALGVLGLSDPTREDAARAIAALRDLGVTPMLVTGDHAGAAQLAGERAAIGEIWSGVLPEGKVERVRVARARGETVLFVGDGINDSAALAAADVGCALAQGADVAIHAADVVVRSRRLFSVVELVALARITLRRIHENLALALLYNAVVIPLAIAGRIEPLGAALAMGISSLAVTGNAVRLLRWRWS